MGNVAVIGLGLIGGSISAALRAAGHEVSGFDRMPGRGAVAQQRGLIDRTAPTLEECARDCEVVILATPISAILSLLPRVDQAAQNEALIVDTGSVKADAVTLMATLGHAATAIGGHPIAGSELSGPEAADAALLQGRPFALCPSERTEAPAIRQAEALVREMGSVPVVISADRHDLVLARTSHLPQIVSTALALSLHSDDLNLSGPGLRGMIRLAASNPNIWMDIATLNRENLAAAMRSFSVAFGELARMIEDGDEEGLHRAMTAGKDAIGPLRVEAPV